LWYVENEKDLLNRCGYCIAGKASLFVDKIVGDFYNVLGLPISKLYSKLNELGYSISDGIAFGFIAYTVSKLAAGKYKEIQPIVYVLDFIFIAYFLL